MTKESKVEWLADKLIIKTPFKYLALDKAIVSRKREFETKWGKITMDATDKSKVSVYIDNYDTGETTSFEVGKI